ncbi:MAG TPA: ATP-binding protein [Candidatus Limnocylindria bacterium]|jgi:predicted kinase
MRRSPRSRTVRISDAATLGQTRALAAHRRALVAQLREEIGVPAAPAGPATLVMLMGLPGVGKSHCARLLAARLGGAHVATDHLRSRLFIAPSYANEENAAVFGIAEALVDELLVEGHIVVLDATHLVARNRAPAENLARSRRVPIHHVLVTSDDASTRARLASRAVEREASDHSDADEGVYERMRSRAFEEPAGGYLEIHNGPNVADEVARVADLVRAGR